jgi:hypothetical protein
MKPRALARATSISSSRSFSSTRVTPWKNTARPITSRNGWFSYDLEIQPDAENVLLCTYWGSDIGNRRFAILFDDQKIAHQTLNRNKPEKFFDMEYMIPEELTRGKNKVTVKVQADAGATAGGVFDLRTLRTGKR